MITHSYACVYTRGLGGLSPTFFTRKVSQIILMLLTGFELGSLMSQNLESDALPTEPPHGREQKRRQKEERGQTYRREKSCFKARLKRGQGGCLTERQRALVPGTRARDRERRRAASRKLGSGDSEAEGI